jgi:hypothetical protein
LPANDAGYLATLEKTLPLPGPKQARPTRFYKPGTDINFTTGGDSADYTLSGWSEPEPWGTWKQGKRASIHLSIESPIKSSALLTVQSTAFLMATHSLLLVTIFCEGIFIGEWYINNGELASRNLAIPASAIVERKDLHLEFRIANSVSPASCGESADHRLLGLGVTKLSLIC